MTARVGFALLRDAKGRVVGMCGHLGSPDQRGGSSSRRTRQRESSWTVEHGSFAHRYTKDMWVLVQCIGIVEVSVKGSRTVSKSLASSWRIYEELLEYCN